MTETVTISGTVVGVFAHRFAVETTGGKVLVDLGPDGAKRVSLNEGDRITVEGRQKPSEIKVSSITAPDGRNHVVDWPKKGDDRHADADPAVAAQAVEAAGFVVHGSPKRKPKHWEINAQRAGQDYELHVELDGLIRKHKLLERESA